MGRNKHSLQNRLLTGLLYALGLASPQMLVACYAPPQSELQYLDDEAIADTLDQPAADQQPEVNGVHFNEHPR